MQLSNVRTGLKTLPSLFDWLNFNSFVFLLHSLLSCVLYVYCCSIGISFLSLFSTHISFSNFGLELEGEKKENLEAIANSIPTVRFICWLKMKLTHMTQKSVNWIFYSYVRLKNYRSSLICHVSSSGIYL